MHIVKLTYFKQSGKFYSDGEYQSNLSDLGEIWQEVKELKEHPGLVGQWSEGFILVNVPTHEHDHPRLIRV